MYLVQTIIGLQCEMILVFHWQFYALMFLALQHCTYAAIHDLVARAMFSEVHGCGFLLLGSLR